ncbi:hypothetical protein, partial [Aquipuribacter sp. MA13-13]|uniref:hypothetical protein n=1 Tax=Aquipuribacter sp. MA13-13 TaxID=3440840 RepID=UPI003EEE5735
MSVALAGFTFADWSIGGEVCGESVPSRHVGVGLRRCVLEVVRQVCGRGEGLLQAVGGLGEVDARCNPGRAFRGRGAVGDLEQGGTDLGCGGEEVWVGAGGAGVGESAPLCGHVGPGRLRRLEGGFSTEPDGGVELPGVYAASDDGEGGGADVHLGRGDESEVRGSGCVRDSAVGVDVPSDQRRVQASDAVNAGLVFTLCCGDEAASDVGTGEAFED